MTMTIDDINNLLKVAATFDKRTIGELDITMWYSALRTFDFPAATAAVVQHYSTTTNYLLPVHIRSLIADQERQDAALGRGDPGGEPNRPAARNRRPDETHQQWMARLQTQNADWYRKHGLHRDASDAEIRAAEGNAERRSRPWTPHTAAERT